MKRAKTKRNALLCLLLALGLLLMAGCGKKVEAPAPLQPQATAASAAPAQAETPAVTPTPAPAPVPAAESDPATSSMLRLPNPIVELESYEALCAALPDIHMSDAPEGSYDVRYSYINAEPVVAQIDFNYGGDDYIFRAAAMAEDDTTDISGVYDALPDTKILAVTDGGSYSLHYSGENAEGLASWYLPHAFCRYSLFTQTGCDESRRIEDVVDRIIRVPGLEAAEDIAVPGEASGSVQGSILSLDENDVVLNLENGSSIVFLLNHVHTLGAKEGDVVELSYTGSLAGHPEALSVEVLHSEEAELVLMGTVFSCTAHDVHVQTATGNVYGFTLDKSTVYIGKAKSLKVGNEVSVHYAGDLDNLPRAIAVETEKKAAEDTENLSNKKLKGLVHSLATKSFVLKTDAGKKYTFPKDADTKITGDYSLAKGAQVQVTYDGYASESPRAKEILVIAPADPTPPSPAPLPTAVPKQFYRVHGYVLSRAGNELQVQDGTGALRRFLIRSDTQIIGVGYPGQYADIDYYLDNWGSAVVTRVVYTSVVPTAIPKPTTIPVPTYAPLPTPAPLPPPQPSMTCTIYGTVVVQAGNAFSVQEEDGLVESFLLRSPHIVGHGGVGSQVCVTYVQTGDDKNVTVIEYYNPIVYTEPETPAASPAAEPAVQPIRLPDPEPDPEPVLPVPESALPVPEPAPSAPEPMALPVPEAEEAAEPMAPPPMAESAENAE